jgi:hypothetical protein
MDVRSLNQHVVRAQAPIPMTTLLLVSCINLVSIADSRTFVSLVVGAWVMWYPRAWITGSKIRTVDIVGSFRVLSPSNVIGSRYGATAAIDAQDNRMYIHNGFDGSQRFALTWMVSACLNIMIVLDNHWLTFVSLCPRAGHSCCTSMTSA